MRSLVIEKALLILTDIHLGFATPVDNEEFHSTDSQAQDSALEDAKRRRVLHMLLDLISLEGIYPSLSPGVGIPLEKRVISSLPTGVIAKQAPLSAKTKSQAESLLHRILTHLLDILVDKRPGIQSIVRGRILSDIISGSADLAFNSQSLTQEQKSKYQNIFERVINEYVYFGRVLRPFQILRTTVEHQHRWYCQHCQLFCDQTLHLGSKLSFPVGFPGYHYEKMASCRRFFSLPHNSPRASARTAKDCPQMVLLLLCRPSCRHRSCFP